jgi:tetratricopeptide (TPR) repeat protein
MTDKDLRNQLVTLLSEIALDPETKQDPYGGQWARSILAGLLEDEAGPVDVGPAIADESLPSPVELPAKAGNNGVVLEQPGVDLIAGQAMARDGVAVLTAHEAPSDGAETADTLVSGVTPDSSPTLPPHPSDHPLFHDAERLIGRGNWHAARGVLAELLTLYPNDTYLKEVVASVQTRSALLDSTQEAMPAPAPTSSPIRSLKVIVPALIGLFLISLVIVSIWAFRAWILPQVTTQRQTMEVAQLRQDAQGALTSGDYDRAVLAYTELLAVLPQDREALDGLEQARQSRNTVSQYSEAIAEMEAQHWENALSLLRQIQAKQPDYRDVQERIAFVQTQQDLSERFSKAEAAFKEASFQQAVQGYEALQTLDYGFQRETVQNHLFLSYLQLGLTTEASAGDDPQKLQGALESLEKAIALRPDDAQAKGEGQLLRLYLASLDEFKASNWSQVVASLTPVYEARPDFAGNTVAQRLYDAYVAWADELATSGEIEQAIATYEQARLISGADTSGVSQKIAAAKALLATPTPTPQPTQRASAAGPAKPKAAPTATPVPLAYELKGMSVKPNCDGFGYIHGIVWSVYGMPMAGVNIKAVNTTTGLGPFISLPTNEDGIYQIRLEKDQIDGLWAIQVLENGQPASQAWGQRLGGGCVNGAQELKVDWQRTRQAN